MGRGNNKKRGRQGESEDSYERDWKRQRDNNHNQDRPHEEAPSYDEDQLTIPKNYTEWEIDAQQEGYLNRQDQEQDIEYQENEYWDQQNRQDNRNRGPRTEQGGQKRGPQSEQGGQGDHRDNKGQRQEQRGKDQEKETNKTQDAKEGHRLPNYLMEGTKDDLIPSYDEDQPTIPKNYTEWEI